MKNAPLIGTFITLSSLYLILTALDYGNIAWFLKPVLLPFLILITWNANNFPTKKWLLTALAFSWIGDIILMFADKGELYFIFGLVAFLISHIFYIVLFLKQSNPANGAKKPLFWLSCIVVAFYLRTMLNFLFPTLGALKIPVSVYALTISVMLIFALKGYFSWNNSGKYFVLLGAVLFVCSDSLLAIDKFYSRLNFAPFGIMVTYLLAQYFITAGILKLNKNSISVADYL